MSQMVSESHPTATQPKALVKKAMNQTSIGTKPSMSMKKLSLVAYQNGKNFSGVSSKRSLLNKHSTINLVNKENSLKNSARNKSALKAKKVQKHAKPQRTDRSADRYSSKQTTPFRQRKISDANLAKMNKSKRTQEEEDASGFTSVP